MATPTTVTFTTDFGSFNVNLFVDSAPLSAANFLSYATNLTTGYNVANSFFHRLDDNFVLQGGGFGVQGGQVVSLPTQAPVPSEASATRPNVTGTIAFATSNNDPNSGTNQFFFNLADNNFLNPGFSTFGAVTSGLNVLQTLNALPVVALNSPFGELPVEGAVAANAVTSNDLVNFRVTVTQTVGDNTPINPFGTATLTDAATTETLTVAYPAANGLLSGGGFAGSPGSLSFTGTPAQGQAALRALVFTPAANAVAPGGAVATGFTLTLAPAGAATRTDTTFAVSALSVNDAPAIGGATAGQAASAGVALQPFANLTVADPDVGQTLTATVTFAGASGVLAGNGVSGGSGSYTLSAGSAAALQASLRGASFTPATGASGTVALTVSVSDGLASTSNAGTTVTLATANPNAPSVTSGFTAAQVPNVLRALLGGADATNPANPIFAQAQAARGIAAQLDAGALTQAQAELALHHLVDGTTSVAVAAYGFFTGRTPSRAGINFLVHSNDNPTDLNDPYYRQFSTENRYINFASNLGTQGDGRAQFTAEYGGLDLRAATAKAYLAVFGTPADAAKVAALLDPQVPNGVGGTYTRADYFAQYGGDGINGQGTKAAMIGFLLSNAVVTGQGSFGAAALNYVEALAHNTAPAGATELVPAYVPEVSLVGTGASLDPSITT